MTRHSLILRTRAKLRQFADTETGLNRGQFLLLCVVGIVAWFIFAAIADAASLRAHVNVDSANVNWAIQEPERLAFDSITTDLHVAIKDTPEPQESFRRTLAAMRAIAPTAPIGTYLSSRMVRAKKDIHAYPAECLDPRYFAESELMAPEWNPPFEPGRFVDYRQPVARAKLVRLITNEAVTRGLPVLLTDNWIHDASYAGFIPWRVTVDYMGELRAALKARGVKLFANIAIAPGAVPDDDIKKLAAATDGVAMEMALVPYVGTTPEALAKAVIQYRTLLDKKVTVVFLVVVPNGTAEQIAAESRFLAALAMVLQSEGNYPLVAAPIFQANPEWHLWLDRFGRPRAPSAGGALTQKGTELSRRFTNGETIIVDCAARTVTVQ